jgi:hypothetical protein
VRRLLISLAAAAALAVAVVPAAFAVDPAPATGDAVTTPASSSPAPEATATPGPWDGQVVEDPTFVSGGELPTQAPGTGSTPAAPGVTPPPTDAPAVVQAAGATLQLPLLLLAAVALLAMLVNPVRRAQPASRGRRRA